MGKPRFDPTDAAKRFISFPEGEQQNETIKIASQPKHTEDDQIKTPSKDKEFKQRGYYITDEQFKKIKMHAVEIETDTSDIVRRAIDEYFEKR